MEYGEAISSRAAEQALEIARAKLARGWRDLRQTASEAVAEAYCCCVVQGEDAAEGHLSPIHANLIDQLELRLRDYISVRQQS
ncbi:MAG TPA: hypothetical protein VNS53_08340 [Sphingomicrobium sp.]|jgi:hypothetical protein|nr:hypothetical protein [Sphingomicrobium sp.]